MARELHPSLSGAPPAKKVCVGCRATAESAALVPIGDSATIFVCFPCAGVAWLDATVELARLSTASFVDAVAPEVPA